mgnify:CR=1 FL=1
MRKGDRSINLLKNIRGSTSLVFICSAFIIILLSAILTDIGYMAFERYKMDRSLDNIAKKGAKALLISKNECVKVIQEDVAKRIKNITKLDINVSENNREMSINLEREIDYIFLKYIGFSDKKIDSRVVAKISNVVSYKGIRPFALPKKELIYGKEYWLFLDKESQYERDDILEIMPVDIGKGNFETGILFGFNKTVHTGDNLTVFTQIDFSNASKNIEELIKKCKRIPKCTYDNYDADCSRIIILPVVDKIEDSAEKSMKVLGFTSFFIEDTELENEDVLKIKGKFIKYTVKSNTSDGVSDFGLLGVKLMH